MVFVSDLKTPVCFMTSLSFSPVCVCPSRYHFYFHFSLLLLPLCLSVCSPAAVPPCSPVWIVCLLLLLTSSAIQTSSLPHSFFSALETLIHHLTVPSHTSPLLHCAHHLFLISLFLALILSLIHLPLKTPLPTVTLPPRTTPVWRLNLKLAPACLQSFSLLTPIQTAILIAAAFTRQMPSLTAFTVHPSQNQTAPTPVLVVSRSIPKLILTLTLCSGASQMSVLAPSKITSTGQMLVLKPCCCPAFTLAFRIIPLPHYSLTLTHVLPCCHSTGLTSAPLLLFLPQREYLQPPLFCLTLTVYRARCKASP